MDTSPPPRHAEVAARYLALLNDVGRRRGVASGLMRASDEGESPLHDEGLALYGALGELRDELHHSSFLVLRADGEELRRWYAAASDEAAAEASTDKIVGRLVASGSDEETVRLAVEENIRRSRERRMRAGLNLGAAMDELAEDPDRALDALSARLDEIEPRARSVFIALDDAVSRRSRLDEETMTRRQREEEALPTDLRELRALATACREMFTAAYEESSSVRSLLTILEERLGEDVEISEEVFDAVTRIERGWDTLRLPLLVIGDEERIRGIREYLGKPRPSEDEIIEHVRAQGGDDEDVEDVLESERETVELDERTRGMLSVRDEDFDFFVTAMRPELEEWLSTMRADRVVAAEERARLERIRDGEEE